MEKFDNNKPRTDLVPSSLVIETAKVLGFGASKYDSDQWRDGTDYSRIYGACLRHLLAWHEGEDNDPESGLNHLAHAACNIAFLLEYIRTGTGNDDRYTYSCVAEDIEEIQIRHVPVSKSNI